MPYPGRAWGFTARKWRECAECGFDWPMSLMIRQNGRFVCFGPNTNECFDEKNYQWFFSRITWPRQEGYDPDPPGPGDVNF